MGVAKIDAAASGNFGPNGPVMYHGIGVAETGGAAAHIRVRDGSVSGAILDTIKLVTGESASTYYAPQGIRSEGRLYLQVVAGTVEATLRFN